MARRKNNKNVVEQPTTTPTITTTPTVKKVKGPSQPAKLRTIDVEIAQKLNTGCGPTRQAALFKLRSAVKKEKFTEMQLLKIWKGLFLSFYNTDKPIVQEEIATLISKLTTSFPDYKDSLAFIKCYFIILQKHWDHIDQYRVDKFYSLTRKMVSSGFQLLKKNYLKTEINETIISGLVKVYKETVLNPVAITNTNGIILHVADIYLEELFKVCQGHIEPAHLTKVLLPFVNYLTKSEDDVACKRIKERVFVRLLTTYSPFDKKDAYFLPKVGIETEDSVPDIFPTDYEMFSKLFFKCASSRDTAEFNRKNLYALKNHFKRAQLALEELEELADNIILDENGDIVENPFVTEDDLQGDDSDQEEVEQEEELEGEEEEEDDEELLEGEEEDDEELSELEGDDDDDEFAGFEDDSLDEMEMDDEEEEEIEVPQPKNKKQQQPQKQQPQKQQPQKQQPKSTKQSPAKPAVVSKQQPKSKQQQSPVKPVSKKQPTKSRK